MHRTYDHNDDKLKFHFALRGIGESTIFPGFCTEHEKIFQVFENYSWNIGNNEQAVALYYRTVAYEYARKRRECDRWSLLADEMAPIKGSWSTSRVEAALRPVQRHRAITLTPALQTAADALSTKNYSAFESVWLSFPMRLGVSSSSCINLHLERYLEFAAQNPGSHIPFFTFNFIPSDSETMLIATWLKQDDKHAHWLRSQLKDREKQELIINRLLFCESEDTCVTPSIWNSVPNKELVIDNMRHVLQRGILDDRDVLKIVSLLGAST
jgi:hypothetical protein